MRSCDYGGTWEAKQDPVMCSPTTSDPYGWVDPITDRVFGVQMIGLETSWICWSDDDGETWLGNPHDSGTTPSQRSHQTSNRALDKLWLWVNWPIY